MEIYLSIKKWIEAGGSRRKWFAGLFLFSFVITGILFISSGSSGSDTAIEPDPLYFTGVIIKLISVLLLIIGAAVLLRRWQLKGGFQKKNGQLGVLETIRLSPRQAIHLVRVGDRHLLIGATDQSINILTQIEVRETVSQPDALNSPILSANQVVQFNQVLESITGTRPARTMDGSNHTGLPYTGVE